MEIDGILSLLPKRISERFYDIDIKKLCEIHLIKNRPMTLKLCEKTVPFGTALNDNEMEETLINMCRGSLHAYEDCIKEGYIPLNHGCRAGVCGKISGGNVINITSIKIRIPRTVYGVGQSLVKRLVSKPSGMLIYSPPGVGKTTLLRDIASALSSPPNFRSVSVIDTRGELFRNDAFKFSCADIYSGYEKAKGIELAVRTMSPEFVICDELGQEEAEALLRFQSYGVPTVASVHAPSYENLMSRDVFARLEGSGVFTTFVGISREGMGFALDIKEGKVR